MSNETQKPAEPRTSCGEERYARGGDVHCSGECDVFNHDEPGGCHAAAEWPPPDRVVIDQVRTRFADPERTVAVEHEVAAFLRVIDEYASVCGPKLECCGRYALRDYAEIKRRDAEWQNWTPTPANINALPEPLFRYVAALETDADPAGNIRDAICARESAEALAKLLAELEADGGKAFISPGGHVYFSTACIHGLHSKCNEVCKYGEPPEPCVCTRHNSEAHGAVEPVSKTS